MISNRRIAGAYLGVLVALIYGVMTGEFPPLAPGKCRAQDDTFRLLYKVLGVSEWRGPQVCGSLRQHVLPDHGLPHQGGEGAPARPQGDHVQEDQAERFVGWLKVRFSSHFYPIVHFQWTENGDTSDPVLFWASPEWATMKGDHSIMTEHDFSSAQNSPLAVVQKSLN